MRQLNLSEPHFIVGGLLEPKRVIARWGHLFEGIHVSPRRFYDVLEEAIERRRLPHTKTSRKYYREGSVFSRRRVYLIVRRKGYRFCISLVLFGEGCFVTWWLIAPKSTFAGLLLKIRFIGPFVLKVFRPDTFHRLDMAQMFMRSIHSAVLDALDDVMNDSGLRSLTELDRRPILDLFNRQT